MGQSTTPMKKLLPLFITSFFCWQVATAQNALQFNETIPNYVEVGNAMNTALSGTNTITVEAWCYLTSYSFLPTAVGNYGTGMQFLLRVDGNKPVFWVDNGGGFRVVTGATTVPLNTWTHLAGVWNGSVLTVYINGVLDGTVAVAGGAFNTTTNPVRIGASLTSESWDGKLDDVRIWTTARTGTEISTYMNGCLPGTIPGLLALYSFEEGAGTTVTDRTGNGYNGTLVSSPAWTTGLGCTTLPVNFVSILAKRTNDNVLISWKVAAEQDLLRYEVERSADGRSFSKAGSVAASISNIYSWLDLSPLPAMAYYRVKSIDISGEIKYSGVAKLIMGDEYPMITVSPNPVQGNEMNLQFRNKQEGRYDIRLVDAAGRLQLVSARQHAGGNSTHTIRLPFAVGRGIYQLIVTDADKKVTTQQLYIDRAK
jgi:hypothetical protein